MIGLFGLCLSIAAQTRIERLRARRLTSRASSKTAKEDIYIYIYVYIYIHIVIYLLIFMCIIYIYIYICICICVYIYIYIYIYTYTQEYARVSARFQGTADMHACCSEYVSQGIMYVIPLEGPFAPFGLGNKVNNMTWNGSHVLKDIRAHTAEPHTKIPQTKIL